jgi:hypothetical protein
VGKLFCSRFHFLVFFSCFRFAHLAFAAFAARALAWGVPAIAFAAFAAAFAFAWGFSASALPPLDPMRLRYCLMDSSTVSAIYYLAANKQRKPFREKRCYPSDGGS